MGAINANLPSLKSDLLQVSLTVTQLCIKENTVINRKQCGNFALVAPAHQHLCQTQSTNTLYTSLQNCHDSTRTGMLNTLLACDTHPYPPGTHDSGTSTHTHAYTHKNTNTAIFLQRHLIFQLILPTDIDYATDSCCVADINISLSLSPPLTHTLTLQSRPVAILILDDGVYLCVTVIFFACG